VERTIDEEGTTTDTFKASQIDRKLAVEQLEHRLIGVDSAKAANRGAAAAPCNAQKKYKRCSGLTGRVWG
jgi:hypothetical protein